MWYFCFPTSWDCHFASAFKLRLKITKHLKKNEPVRPRLEDKQNWKWWGLMDVEKQKNFFLAILIFFSFLLTMIIWYFDTLCFIDISSSLKNHRYISTSFSYFSSFKVERYPRCFFTICFSNVRENLLLSERNKLLVDSGKNYSNRY